MTTLLHGTAEYGVEGGGAVKLRLPILSAYRRLEEEIIAKGSGEFVGPFCWRARRGLGRAHLKLVIRQVCAPIAVNGDEK